MIVSLPDKTRSAKTSPPSLGVAGGPSPAEPGAATGGQSEDVFVFPATAAQRRFWLLDQLVPGGNPALSMPIAARLTGRLDGRALERAFLEIVRRHEILRTTFHCEKGQLQQVISPELYLPIPLVDVRDFPEAERLRVPEHLLAEEAQRPFDLARGPVIRARLVRLAPQEHLLLVTLHHIVSDGWSNGVVLRELGELYAAFVRGKPSPLPELPIQFADFAQWQQDQAVETGFRDQMAYWRETLAGELPVLDLPTDRPRRPTHGRATPGAQRREILPVALVHSLKALAVREGVSVYMLHLAVYAVLLGRYGGREDILVVSPSANRDRSEVEGLIGPFVNPLLLRLDLSGHPTFRELLGRVRRVVLGAFEHAAAPFEKVLEEFQPRLIQTNFLYQSNFLQPARLPDLDLVPLTAGDPASITEWSAAVIEDGAETRISIEYMMDLFDTATIDRVLAGYQRLLEAVVAPEALDMPVTELPLEPFPGPSAESTVLRANRWRLPTESVRWMDGCFETADVTGEGVFGHARHGVEVFVLDDHLQPSPVGVAGEIHVGSMPESVKAMLATLAWVEHPRLGALLKTGDLARRLPDDSIEWMGRVDEQVRVHGLRVDPGEVETALLEHPHITQAVVLWCERRDGNGRRLTAYFQSDGAPPALVSHTQLRAFLRESLPEDLIPAAFVPMKRFPLTSDGRLDTAALPEPAPKSARSAEENYDAPYLTIHHQIIEIWSELLHVPSIGIRDDFFALGGNSLLAMRMLYRVEQACGKALLPATLFQQATVEHLAGEILRQDVGETAPDVVRICETGTKAPIFYLHGDLTGGGYYCMKLSRRLGPDQPFYALPPLPFDEVRDMPSIEEMAARHLKTLRSVRPHGPYVIGGFCIGGLIAQELARQLVAEGEPVERLLIIDASPDDRRLRIFRRMAERLGRLRGWNTDRQLYHFCRWHFLAARLERWTGLDLRQQSAIFRRRLGDAGQRVLGKFRPVKPALAASTPPETAATTTNEAWFDPRWDTPLVFLWAVAGFKAKSYAGPTTVLLSRDLSGGAQGNPAREWKKHNPQLESRELVGSHLACITEHADALAETIRACLQGPAV